MNEKNELNDIILNRGGASGGNKKIVLAVATLGVILIIVVMLMSTLTPDAKENLPQPIPLPTQQTKITPTQKSEPLFEEVVVVEESSKNSDSLDEIAQRLKQESIQDSKKTTKVEKKAPAKKEVKKVTKPAPKKVAKETTKESTSAKSYFIQVGSFSKYQPNKKFLDSILNQGYRYKFHKVGKLNKVLVGPFYSEKEARSALRVLRSNIEAGAFLVRF